MRIVVSLTTLPTRYDKLLTTLKSLARQTKKPDKIYLGIPPRAARLNQEYPPLPAAITEHCQVVPLIRDYGPISKLIAALSVETDPNTIIITVDDDISYPRNFIEQLLAKAQAYPNTAIGSTGLLIGDNIWQLSSVSALSPDWNGVTGFNVPPEGREVDILCGVSGILYYRNFFETEELVSYSDDDPDLFVNDDVVISAYLAQKNIPRRLFTDIPFGQTNPSKDESAISFSRWQFLQRLYRAITKSRASFTAPAPTTVNDSPVIRIVITVLVVAIIAICIYLFIRGILPAQVLVPETDS